MKFSIPDQMGWYRDGSSLLCGKLVRGSEIKVIRQFPESVPAPFWKFQALLSLMAPESQLVSKQ